MIDLGIRVDDAPAALPDVTYQWDPETEILSGRFTPGEGARGLTGTVELSSGEGAILAVDVERGVLCGVEVVVWPRGESVEGLDVPEGTAGRIVIPARPSQPGVGAVELETALRLTTSPDEGVLHFAVGEKRATRPVRIARQLVVELDGDNRVAGLWLEGVPAFPAEDA